MVVAINGAKLLQCQINDKATSIYETRRTLSRLHITDNNTTPDVVISEAWRQLTP